MQLDVRWRGSCWKQAGQPRRASSASVAIVKDARQRVGETGIHGYEAVATCIEVLAARANNERVNVAGRLSLDSPVPHRRLRRSGYLVLLCIGIAFVVASAVERDVRLIFVAIWPSALGLFGTIAYKTGATIRWAGRWLR